MNWIENKIKSVDTKDAQIKYSEWLTTQKQKADNNIKRMGVLK